MKNPFTSTDNIFERIGKKEPVRKDAALTRGSSLRQYTPKQGQKMSFGNNKPSVKATGLIQNTVNYESVGSEQYSNSVQVDEAYCTQPRQRIDQHFLPTNTYSHTSEAVEQQFGLEDRRQNAIIEADHLKPRRVTSNQQPAYRQNQFPTMKQLQPYRTQSTQKDNNSKYTITDVWRQSQEQPTYSKGISCEQSSDTQILGSPPDIGKSNPFLKPNLLMNVRKEERFARRSEKTPPVSPIVMRQKSLTNPNKVQTAHQPVETRPQYVKYTAPINTKNRNPNPIYQQPYQPSYQSSYEPPNDACNVGPHTHMLPKGGPHNTSHQTLHKLDQIFNEHSGTNYGDIDMQITDNRSYKPMSLDISPLQSDRPQNLDAALFENYIKICMMDSAGREELRKLADVDIPEPIHKIPKEKQFAFHQMKKIVTVDSKTEHVLKPLEYPSVNVVSRQQHQPTKSYVPSFKYQVESPTANITKTLIESSSILVRGDASELVNFRDLTQVSHDTLINLDQSVPKVKPYMPQILTEKSNLKLMTSNISNVSQLKSQTNPIIEEPDFIRLESNCDLTKRVEERLRKVYQNSSIRNFLTFDEKLTMKHYPLQQN